MKVENSGCLARILVMLWALVEVEKRRRVEKRKRRAAGRGGEGNIAAAVVEAEEVKERERCEDVVCGGI